MSARPLHVLLVGAPLILSTIAPIPIFASVTELDVQDLYNQCMGARGSLNQIFCLEFVAAVARQAFRNGLALKDIRDDHAADLMTMSCPKSFVSNDAIAAAFNQWASQHFEEWGANAETGVMRAMHDTWPCF